MTTIRFGHVCLGSPARISSTTHVSSRRFQRMAAEKGATATQLAIAWVLVLVKNTSIVPLIGARTRRQLTESLGALPVTLSSAEMAQIEAALPPAAIAGIRCDEHQMRVLDSER
jgi:aryl-alcohol dehydrogenase-like predicted oxidoreductase